MTKSSVFKVFNSFGEVVKVVPRITVLRVGKEGPPAFEIDPLTGEEIVP
ncbi:MAG: hypothetical protein ACD_52C00325G0010 [uncultured bacterium]|nr:MAG: hypothetical protein ACD_52C00325G0010 [uncultured bacterium]